jgi:hypothetical protein
MGEITIRQPQEIEHHTLASDYVLVADFQRTAMAADDQRITANLIDCGKRGEERSRFAHPADDSERLGNGADEWDGPKAASSRRGCGPTVGE